MRRFFRRPINLKVEVLCVFLGDYLGRCLIPTVGDESTDSRQLKNRCQEEMTAPSGPQPAVHLASYRSRKQAERGWSQLKRAHGALLGGLDSQVTPVNLGAGKDTYFRLKAGPVANKGAAVDLCRKLKRRRQYCEPTIMENG